MDKATQERYKKIANEIYNSEDLMDFVEWYADRLGLTSFIDEFGDEVESDLSEQIRKTKLTWEEELEKPTRNWKEYKKEAQDELAQQNRSYMRSVL